MKRLLLLSAVALLIFFSGCTAREAPAQIAATTLPVYEFTSRLCEGTDLTVGRLVTESVSCLHDYSLNVRQVRTAESADLIVISGAGLEEFMEDLLHIGRKICVAQFAFCASPNVTFNEPQKVLRTDILPADRCCSRTAALHHDPKHHVLCSDIGLPQAFCVLTRQIQRRAGIFRDFFL